MPQAKQSNNIRVMCRFRPMNEVEQSKDSTIIYKLLKANGTMIEHPDKVHHPQPMSYYFDKIFDRKAPQVEVFEEAALPLIENYFAGYNATIFAYGQTGAGKTHTMMGDMIRSDTHPRRGIIPRVVAEIWNRIVHAPQNIEFELKVSFLEIYNEEIYDLLSTSSCSQRGRKKKKRKQKLMIREYSDQVFVENLNEIYVRDQNELFDLIKSANKKRVSAETKMNRNSSRSHAVLTISLGQEHVHTGCSKKSKFCLVDLAGSEKVGKTQAKGIRLKEATSINKSLTTLGTCMNKLAENMKSNDSNFQRHIPFRESVLTRLLSDSLGGNCKTTLIINTSPCSYNVEETISTLRFGERAKKIKTKARINQIKTPQQYRKELQTAQTEIMKLYHIIENCAADICTAFTGTLNVETCKSYKALLDLKKHTLSIVNGGSKSSKAQANEGLLANIFPDLTHLRSLKKVPAIRKQQKHLFSQTPSAKAIPPARAPSPRQMHNPHITMIKQEPPNRLRQRTSSFERLDVDCAVKLQKKKKQDPLKKKKDFKVNRKAQGHFQPPQFDSHMFDVPSHLAGFGQEDDGLSLGQMGQGLNIEYNSNVEDSEFSDYNSEFDNLAIMSPAVDMLSDTSTSNIFTYHDARYSDTEQEQAYTDFNEEELPKHFFEMSKEERLAFAKKKRVDPMLIEYRFEIQKGIDWKEWNSDDEEESNASDTEQLIHRVDIERNIEFNKQRLLMLCRLIRTKTQEYASRMEVETGKYKTLAKKYRAKNEENNKLMQQNTSLEKLYERGENEKMNVVKDSKRLKRECTENKKKMHKLQKQLDLKQNELNIEKQAQINLSSNKASVWRKRIHEKYGASYAKKIEKEVIRNHSKDIKLRFHELARAFKSQSSKYQDLEHVIESTKRQISKYEELIRQKEDEEHELRDEIENDDQVRKELILQHNLEVKQIRQLVKKSKNKADMWKRKAFVYKNAVNSLMEEEYFNSEEDEDDEDNGEDSDNKKLNINLNVMAHKKLKPLQSLSPRSMQKSLEEEEEGKDSRKKARYGARKSQTQKRRDRYGKRSSYDRYISPTRDDPFHMTPSQKTSLTSVKMKIRGGGRAEEEAYRTPVKSTTAAYVYKKGSLSRKTPPRHKRQSSQPMNGSLTSQPGSNHRFGCSDDYIMNNRSRSPVPIGIDALLRNKSIEVVDPRIMVSPSLYHMSKSKKASPSPPPFNAAAEEDSASDSLEDPKDISLLRNSGEYMSPAGTFFSKIKHINDDDDEEEDDADDDSKSKSIQIMQHKKKRRVAVSMPEPCSDDAYDEAETPYSDDISTDEGGYDGAETPSYRRHIPTYKQRLARIQRNDSGRLTRLSAQNVFDNKSRRSMDI